MFKRNTLIVVLTALLGLSVLSCAPAPAQEVSSGNFYGGASVTPTQGQGGIFLGYEDTKDVLYYAVEGAYNFADRDSMSVTARAGTELYDNFVGYGVVGYGWRTDSGDANGATYGFGGKYNIDSNFSIGTEYLHQEYQRCSTDKVSLRGIFKF